MPRLRFTQRSRADLGEIHDRIAADSPRAAQATIDRIVERARMLRDQPLSGHTRDDLFPGIRSVRSGKYFILHELKGDVVVIAHVLHHARNLPVVVAQRTRE